MKEQEIDTSQFSPFSNDQLKAQMQRAVDREKIRHPEKPISERAKRHSAKLAELKNVPYDSRKESVLSTISGMKAQVKPKIVASKTFKEAKKLFYECMKAHAQKSDYIINIYPDLKEVCLIFAAYFSGNEVEGIDPHKGFFLYGPCGCGKTEIFSSAQAMAKICGNKQREFGSMYVPDLIERFDSYTDYYIGNWLFDDLGSGQMIKNTNYVKKNPMEMIFSNRHRKMSAQYLTTHVTSNIKPSDFDSIFDKRVISRFGQMFNFIKIDGPDFRNE